MQEVTRPSALHPTGVDEAGRRRRLAFLDLGAEDEANLAELGAFARAHVDGGAREPVGAIARLDERTRSLAPFQEQLDDVASEQPRRTRHQGLHPSPIDSARDGNLNVARRSSPVVLTQTMALTVINTPVNGCENRNIAPTADRLTPNKPEKIRRPTNSLLPR